MATGQLDLIRRFCDTRGIRLSSYEKDLLCRILSDPGKYDGFESREYEDPHSGSDYRDTWESVTKRRFRIRTVPRLIVEEDFMHRCDGYEQKQCYHLTNLRDILERLKQIESEL